MSSPQMMFVDLELPIRTYDIDFAGIVSNIVYIRWLEDLRIHLLAQHYLALPDLILTGIAPVLVQTEIKYQRQLTIHDRPIGKMWIVELESVRCRLAAEIIDSNNISATANQTVIFIDLTTRRPVRIPAALRDRL
jgi:acyl-CoA thioester hydrolase